MQRRGDEDFSWESPSSNRNLLIPRNLLFAVAVTRGVVVTKSLLRGWQSCGESCVLMDCFIYFRAVFVPHSPGGNGPSPGAPWAQSRGVQTGGNHGLQGCLVAAGRCHQIGGKGNN